MSSDLDRHTKTVLSALDDSLKSASDSDLARLESARINALNAIPRKDSSFDKTPTAGRTWPNWWAGMSLASVILAAIVYVQLIHSERPEEHIRLSVQEAEWIMGTDDFDVLSEELEFYEWLGAELDLQNTDS